MVKALPPKDLSQVSRKHDKRSKDDTLATSHVFVPYATLDQGWAADHDAKTHEYTSKAAQCWPPHGHLGVRFS